MAMPTLVVVAPGPIASGADVDTITTLMLVVLAAGIGWFLWRRK